MPDTADNQRLEFLGDAVVQLCTSQHLYRNHPKADEGKLTRLRAQLVNADALAKIAVEYRLFEPLRLGKGAENAGLRKNKNVQADLVEALLGATYLQHGLEITLEVFDELLAPLEEAIVEENSGIEAKTELQERSQAAGFGVPQYELLASSGPDHNKRFEIQVSIAGLACGVATERSKRAAERASAALVLEQWPQLVATIKAAAAEATDATKEDDEA